MAGGLNFGRCSMQHTLHCTAQNCISIIFCPVKIHRLLNYMPSEFDFSSNKPMFSRSFKESGLKKIVKLLYATFENINLFDYAIHNILPLKEVLYILA